eukprot:1134961-Prymnesium_polylepis.1
MFDNSTVNLRLRDEHPAAFDGILMTSIALLACVGIAMDVAPDYGRRSSARSTQRRTAGGGIEAASTSETRQNRDVVFSV